jgi:hypothetical protein
MLIFLYPYSEMRKCNYLYYTKYHPNEEIFGKKCSPIEDKVLYVHDK